MKALPRSPLTTSAETKTRGSAAEGLSEGTPHLHLFDIETQQCRYCGIGWLTAAAEMTSGMPREFEEAMGIVRPWEGPVS